MTDTRWKPRATARHQKRRDDGTSIWAFGLRAGYWPCLRAPFARLDAGPFIVELWCGWRSYIIDSEQVRPLRDVGQENL